MPKIMFRPNPTPPPFPPPTPVPTENLVHINPYPFDQDQEISCKLVNITQPADFDSCEFCQLPNASGDYITLCDAADGEGHLIESFTAIPELSSSNTYGFILVFYKNFEEVQRVPLTLI